MVSRLLEDLQKRFAEKSKGFKETLAFLSLFRKARGGNITWGQPSPKNPALKAFLTKGLDKEWGYDEFWEEFTSALVAVMHDSVPDSFLEKGSGTDYRIVSTPGARVPTAMVRANKETGLCQGRTILFPWRANYQIHREPFVLEAWCEALVTPGYNHNGLRDEKQSFVDSLLSRTNIEIPANSVLVRDAPSPADPWTSILLTDPLDKYGSFDTIWKNLLELLQISDDESIKVQNVVEDGFTVFSKGAGSRSSWTWVKYTFNKHKSEVTNARVGPAVHHMTCGEIMGEHYGAWRDKQFLSYMVLYRKPLQLEFRGETLEGVGPRIEDANPTLYHIMLQTFGRMHDKRHPPSTSDGSRGLCGCGRRRTASPPTAPQLPEEEKEKDE